MDKVLISTECVADLPTALLEENRIEIIYFDIKTESGVFRDTDEIDSHNVMEYMMGGKQMAYSIPPSANNFQVYFSNLLKKYQKIVHICISSGISSSYQNAMLATEQMGEEGKRVHIVDSKSLSGGQGLITLEAVRLKNSGLSCEEIVSRLNGFIPRVSTTFLSNNADYLYYNGKVKKGIRDLCHILRVHPVLSMENGKLSVRKVYIGNYNRGAKKYIKRVIKKSNTVIRQRAFINYAGCSVDMLETIKSNLDAIVHFEELYCQQASATISCNCGPKTFGILFVKK